MTIEKYDPLVGYHVLYTPTDENLKPIRRLVKVGAGATTKEEVIKHLSAASPQSEWTIQEKARETDHTVFADLVGTQIDISTEILENSTSAPAVKDPFDMSSLLVARGKPVIPGTI